MLVVGGVQVVAQLVGGGPELGFEALVAGGWCLLFWFSWLGRAAWCPLSFCVVISWDGGVVRGG